MEYRVIDSLHRPYHRPLWIVKWVCYFLKQREKSKRGYILCKDRTTDFYFSLINWLYERYPIDNDGIPSRESVADVWELFKTINQDEREARLRDVLSNQREKGVETKVYSTYKAASYYLNLADDKLHFVSNDDGIGNWENSKLTKAALKSGISTADRSIYLRRILWYDGHFFMSMCLLQKPTLKYSLSVEEEIYKFMQRYYPSANFDYARQSHSNYYVVRKRWVELLQSVNQNGNLSRTMMSCIKSESFYLDMYYDVERHVQEYVSELRQRSIFVKQKKQFISIYQNKVRLSDDKSLFVNLYDISKEMRMNYHRFQSFLSNFYQEERMVRNIFFINIVSTIEQRKRFYIGKAPVIKIKMTKNYGV